MLSKWTISNFKSIKKPISLDLAPVTILAGANSSGKSAFLQSILMVAQSFKSPVRDRALVLNGELVQLGHFKEILHYGNEDVPIEIGCDIQPEESGRLLSFHSRIAPSKATYSVAKSQERLIPVVKESSISVHFDETSDKSHPDEYGLEMALIPDAKLPIDLKSVGSSLRQHIRSGTFDYEILQPTAENLVSNEKYEKLLRVSTNNMIPRQLLIGSKSELRNLVKDVEKLNDLLVMMEERPDEIPSDIPYGTLSPLINDVFSYVKLPERWRREARMVTENRSYRRGGSQRSDKRGDASDMFDMVQALKHRGASFTWTKIVVGIYDAHFEQGLLLDLSRRLASALSEYLRDQSRLSILEVDEIEVRLLPSQYAQIIEEIAETFSEHIYYLGPLRDTPRVMYASPPALGQTHVGLTGEYTAAMLDEYRNKEIDYPIPPKDFDGKYRTAHGTLIEALLVWLKRMDLLDAIDTEETSKVGYRLSVQGKGVSETQDLTSVGVGVSQVLPTLVLFLLAPNNSILLIEQPELHLHPKVQSILGDFFLGMAECGKQCIVETHSEYIVNRLRRRIVETPGKRILDKIKIYFVEKEKAESRFREVQPNEYGSIHDWPKGFFDEVDREASRILDAQMNKRRQAR